MLMSLHTICFVDYSFERALCHDQPDAAFSLPNPALVRIITKTACAFWSTRCSLLGEPAQPQYSRMPASAHLLNRPLCVADDDAKLQRY